jgi:hypothetical protein
VKRIRVTIVQILEVSDAFDDAEEVDLDAFKDSLLSSINDQQGEPLQTTDEMFDVVPDEVVSISASEEPVG